MCVDCCCSFSIAVHEFELTAELAQSFEEAEQHRSQFMGNVHLEQLAVLKQPVRNRHGRSATYVARFKGFVQSLTPPRLAVPV